MERKFNLKGFFVANWRVFVLLANLPIMILLLVIFISAGKNEHSNENLMTPYDNPLKIHPPIMPEKLDLAGEPVPLENWEVYERVERELIENTYRHAKTFLIFKRAGRFFPIMEPILKQNGIPRDFLYLCVIESELSQVVSPAGATGFWQFMKNTGQEFNLEINDEIDERYHVEKSTQAACDYLNKAYKKFNSWTLAAASYNMGMAGLEQRISEQMQISYYNLDLSTETSRYVARILALKVLFQNPKKYSFHIENSELYPSIPVKSIKVAGPIINLASFAAEHRTTQKIIKELNPWLRKNYLKNTGLKTYSIYVPDTQDFNYHDAQKRNSRVFDQSN